ncbi:MAG: NifU family protein [Acidimicrobiales bacterium]
MGSFDDVLDRMEQLLAQVEDLDEEVRDQVFALLDGVDTIHRMALGRMGAQLGPAVVDQLHRADPAVAWLLDAYGVGADDRHAADAALDDIRPYVHSHGGRVEVLGVEQGVVHLRMSGACSGCTASAVTLREGIEDALRERFPGFQGVEVEEDHAEPHPPPGATLVEIRRHRDHNGDQ